MRVFRFSAAATAIAVVTALISMSHVSAATAGVGTATASTSVAQLSLGDGLLSARVIGDDSRSTLDPAVGTPEAASVLRPLTLGSAAVDALNVALPAVEVRSTGAEQRLTTQALDVGAALGALDTPLPGVLASGTVAPADLFAIVDAEGARSALDSALTDLTAAGGLVAVDSVTAALGTNAARANTTSNRGLDIDSVTALNLGALLEGLGIPLTSLSTDQVAALIDRAGLLDSAAVVELVGELADLAALQALLDEGAAAVDTLGVLDPLCETGSELVGDLALPANPLLDPTAACGPQEVNLQDLVDDLVGVLNGLLGILDGTPLLALEGVEAGVNTKATDDVATSVAEVTAAVGGLQVGDISLPGVDLLDTAEKLANTTSSVVGAVDSVLAAVDTDGNLSTLADSLAGIVDVKLLDSTGTGVQKAGEYVQANARLTAVQLSVNPGDVLDAIIAALGADDFVSVGDLLGDQGAALPNTDAMAGLAGLFPAAAQLGATQVLGDGATLRLGVVSSGSTFTVAAPGTPGTTPGRVADLPSTGGFPGAPIAAAVAILGLAGVAVRRRLIATD